MQPIHSGLSNNALYNGNAFRTVAICLDSGKIATEACQHDARGIDRVVYVNVYPGDEPTETCDKHIMVNYCAIGGGVATDYCSMFPEADVRSVALVKLTEAEVQEIRDAVGVGLNNAYLNDMAIYYDGEGGWFGFRNNVNNPSGGPYIECSLHGPDSWQDYQDSIIQEPDYGSDDDYYDHGGNGWDG